MEGYMDSSMFRAAVLGDTSVLEDAEQEEHKYLLKTPDLGNNIVHIAALRGHSTFIEKALERFPDLVRQKNKKGNSPLHESAQLGNKETINVIISCLSKDKDGVSSGSASGNTSTNTSVNNTSVSYLCEVNSDGDTPLHSALRRRNMAAVEALFAYVKAQPQLLLISNNFGETPLHLYVRYCAGAIFPEDLEHDDNNNAVGKQKFIDEMINANPLAIFEHDLQGMNPLMRAAQYGRVLVVHQILANHTHSIECRDRNGRNFLHHLRLIMVDFNARDKGHTLWMCEKILEIIGVDALTVSCDQDGNTPLHKAILDREFNLAYLILQSCVESESAEGVVLKHARLKERKELILSTKNDEGKTIIDLITSGPDIPANLKNMMDRVNTGSITVNIKYKLALKYPEDNEDKYINDVISEGNGSNVIYIALHHGKAEYFDRALSRYPNMIYHKGSNGDTPLHIAARVPSDVAREVLRNSFRHWIDKNRQSLSIPPWRVKNSRGHTIFHEAVRSSNYGTLEEMYTLLCGETDPDLQRSRDEALLDINESGETVLHLLAKYCHRKEDFVRNIIYKSGFSAYMRDVDGFAPILRAAHSGHTLVALAIYRHFPTSIRMSDYSGRTVLHHLCTSVLKVSIGELESLLKKLGDDSIVMSDLMSSQDIDGNTPLHVGILNRNFEAVQCFIKHFINAKSSLEMKELFIHLKNNDGKSVWDMISNGSDIPQILKKLMNQLLSVETTLDDKLYEAATIGDTGVIYEADTTFWESVKLIQKLRAQTPDGSNFIHIALRHHQFSFIQCAFRYKHYIFYLIYKEDSKGDTPLHIAARLQPSDDALNFFKLCIKAWYPMFYAPPWTVRNSRGDTFLHEAARAGNTYIISFVWELHYMNNDITDGNDSYSFWALIMDAFSSSALKEFDITDVNDYGETVLHVIARYATYAAKDFLEKHSPLMKSLVYKRDNEGFTPILRAVQSGRLGMARLLVQQFPPSAELRDDKGRSILHHLRALVVDLADDLRDILPVWKDFFEYSEVDGLRIVQNEDGNTPLHLAVIDADYTKAKFLMEVCLQSNNKQELDIVNNDGHTVFDLLSTRAHLPTMKQLLPLVNRSNVKERESTDNMMNDELYLAAVNGSIQIFDAHTVIDVESGEPKLDDQDYFCSQTPGGNNIVHIALRHGSKNAEQFVARAVEYFPNLSMRPDNNGDTPLHLAVKCKGNKSGELLVRASERFLEGLAERQKSFHVPPWAVKNNKGNFPIHEALQTNNLKDASILLECDNEAASRVNDLGETPLHSFAKNGFSLDKEASEFVETLSKTSSQAAYLRDDEGLTPLLRAASSGRLVVARAILKHHPQSAYLRDPSGRTFLHLLRFTGEDVDESFSGTFKKTGKQLFEIAEADAQRLVQDYEGNTPLHYAIKTGNSIAAIVLTQKCLETDDKAELGLVNKEGQTVSDLLAIHDVPNEIIEKIQKKMPKAVYLARSSYGIRKAEMKESANALSVVAALLATITFAAAFQVPGGFDGDNGFPVLLMKPAFTVFVVANTIAMCCSMLCLFLLLWVMGIGKIHGSLKVLDISIILLRLSFYLTLLTFTMGVFVVTAKKSFWLALLVCGLCLLTSLLTWKHSIKFVATLANYSGRVIDAIRKFRKFIMKSIQKQFNSNHGVQQQRN